jgi:ribA/ribD-fused uncharacterized protein
MNDAHKHPASLVHREIVLEQHLVSQLVRGQGYVERNPDDYDRPLGLDKALVVRFVRETQPDEWLKLESQYAASAEAEFFKQLERALKQRGTLDVLRQGVRLIPGIRFALCFFEPASKLNPDLVRLYQTNILSAIRQVRYSLKNENAIDVVLFVNGIAVATAELKNLLTGSTFKHAEKQYRTDRSPAGEPLLTFKRGALVHFALDEDNVSMTTRLMNGKTRFLPFNRGRDGGAGNSDIPGEFRVAYLYADQPEGKAIFSREVWLDVLGRFVHVEQGDDGKATMIFPRFQQLDAARRMMAHARVHGAGNNYLIEHSAGSGKSNTIGWTAHQAINLHDETDQSIFDTAIVVTDRIVLDRQLQSTVSQFEQTRGVVRKIDGTSRQLKEAIECGARIIVTTIQKFSTDHLAAISGQGTRKYSRYSAITFRKTTERFGGLSNMASGFPLSVNGISVRTSEALYQACRFPHLPDVQHRILSERSPMTAKMRSKPFRSQTRPDWDSVRVPIMKWCLRVKLAQNWRAFSLLLLSTDSLPIVEDSRKDDYWGAKPVTDDTLFGQNVLGRLLMELREKLKEKPDSLKIVEPVPVDEFLLLGRPIPVIHVGDISLPERSKFERPSASYQPPRYVSAEYRTPQKRAQLGLGFHSASGEKVARPSAKRRRAKAPTAASWVK